MSNNSAAKKKPVQGTKPAASSANQNWLNRGVSSSIAGVGNWAGGTVNGVGDGVSGAGRYLGNGVSAMANGWADSVRQYGNSIKDATGAGGTRAATGSNALGLSGGSGYGGGGSSSSAPRKGTASNPLGL